MVNIFLSGFKAFYLRFTLLDFILLAKTGEDGTTFDPSMLYLIIALLGIFVAVLFLLLTRARIFPLIRLGFIRLRYGRYSFEFIEFFKANNIRNPHNNCIKDEISMHFYIFYKPKRDALFFQTETKIDFGKIPFLTSYKKLACSKGEPDCINIARFDHSRVKLVGFNETLQNMKIKTLFYLVEDLFVMGEYHFPDLNRIKADEILTPLTRKYLKNESVHSDNLYITDPSGNKINFENNGFSITIRYLFHGNEKLNSILDSLFGNTGGNGNAFIKTMKQEELLNRL